MGFAIAAGETYGLLGPNGAGKTTTIAMLCGVIDRDSGEIMIDGTPLDGAGSPAKRGIGFVPQDVALYSQLSARENLRFFGRLYGLRGSTLRDRIEYALGAVGLTDRDDDHVSSYSGGMKRRCNLAAGLLHQGSVRNSSLSRTTLSPSRTGNQRRFATASSVSSAGRTAPPQPGVLGHPRRVDLCAYARGRTSTERAI